MSVTTPQGFVAAGVACGIKTSGNLDLSLVATDDAKPVPAAGVFTTNKAAAAPVQVSRSHLDATGGQIAAVVLSSGNANAATGAAGRDNSLTICELVADGLGAEPSQVLICQTGLIGIPLPMEPIKTGIPALVAARAGGREAAVDAATAIMTTDSIRKESVVSGDGFVVGGMAKGAAMLAPNMATMLAVLTTDAVATPARLQTALLSAVDGTFNRLSVDGCTSTNDTVLVLASGRSGVQPTHQALTDALSEVCLELSVAMATDAEGATKVCHVVVDGAVDDRQAHLAARKVAESQLVQCSLNGEDPYWGRVVSELGSSGAEFDVDLVEVAYGGVVVCAGGVAVDHDAAAVAEHMRQRSIELTCDLGLGSGRAAVLTTDLGHGYIDENRTTS